MKTLIQIQDEALAKLNVTRSSERRYARLRKSVRCWYYKQLAKIGYIPRNDTMRLVIAAMWQDVRDVSELNKLAGE